MRITQPPSQVRAGAVAGDEGTGGTRTVHEYKSCTTRPNIDTLKMRAASMRCISLGRRADDERKIPTVPHGKESIMKRTVIKLGAVSRVTKDYSGNFWWDSVVYDYRKYRTWG